MSDLMDRDEYNHWWQDNTDDDGELLASLPEPVATLAAHVMALQGRIDDLPDPERIPGGEFGRAVRCCCAYDHPNAVCMVHKVKP